MAQATILVADDDKAIRTVLNQALGRLGYDVRLTGHAAQLWKWVADGDGDLVITDVVMPDENGLDLVPRIRKVRPDLRVIVMSAQNTLLTAIKATERGAFEYLPKPFDLKELVSVVERALTAPKAPVVYDGDPDEPDEKLPLIGRSAAMQEIYRVLARLMATDLTVMINGESGTGKELVARALHDYGKRRNGPFVALNMAAIPRELIESELFGHEKGAFTGATSRYAGRFEQSQGGTLFLDEIGDMPLEAQTRLLRVLQEGEYTTVGGRTRIRADVRIGAATHRDLRLLVRHFLQTTATEGLPVKTIDATAMERLKQHRWPGNVRELENLIRRLTALYSQEVIGIDIVESELAEAGPAPVAETAASDESLGTAVDRHLKAYFAAHKDGLPPIGVYDRIVREVERPLLSLTLIATRGNQIKAAQLLGLNRNTLRKKIRELDIQVVRGLK